MEVTIEDRAKVWRDRGRPKAEIPPEIMQMAESTYKTGKVITISPETEEEKGEAAELLKLLRGAARRQGRHLKVQRQSGKILAEMVDKPATPRKAGKR